MKTKKAGSRRIDAVQEKFAQIAGRVSQAAGSVWAFSAAALIVVVWFTTGPIFGFSEVWQLVINTGTTIITFLMVFVIQHAQNKDMRTIQLKLNELVAAVEGASNRLIDVEDLSDEEVERLYERYQRLASSAQKLSKGAKISVEKARVENESAATPAERKHAVPIKREARGRKNADH